MTYAYKQACSEVCFILENLEESIRLRIPEKIIKVLEKNKVKYYDVNIDLSMPLYNQIMKDETKAILSLLYRKFLCDESERVLLEENYKKRLEEEMKQQLTNTQNIAIENVEEKDSENIISNKQEMIIEVKKVSVFAKILSKLKNMFIQNKYR